MCVDRGLSGCAVGSLIAAGSEGEVHLVQIDVAGKPKQVGLKVPHIDGMDAMVQVLEVAQRFSEQVSLGRCRRLLCGLSCRRAQILQTLA